MGLLNFLDPGGRAGVAVGRSAPRGGTRVAIAHDYLTQRGGAERVVLALAKAFPGAPIHTTVYDPGGTFPEFSDLEIHTTPLQHIGALRRNPRRALPLLASAVSNYTIDADVTICSTSGWAHGFRCTGRKVAYVHNTARWLYQTDEYLAALPRSYGAALAPLAPGLRRWDRRAAASIDTVLANSAVTKQRVAKHWRREADVIHPPPGLSPDGPEQAVDGLAPGFFLTVARLLPYKRVDIVIDAVAGVPGARLVVVGDGPDRTRLAERAPSSALLLANASDSELRWLYRNAAALVTAAHDDFGLTAIEAMAFGTPVLAPDEGGYRETVNHGVNGLLYDEPSVGAVRQSIALARQKHWESARIRGDGELGRDIVFLRTLQGVIQHESSRAGGGAERLCDATR